MEQRIVGVIPMAGNGTRLKPLPFSKELYPVGFWETNVENEMQKRPKVVAQYLIEGFKAAGIKQVYIILSPNKYDILQHFGSGHILDIEISYIVLENSKGMPFTIDSVYHWLSKDDMVMFGMADTIISPPCLFQNLRDEFINKGADLILGAFKTLEPWKFGMIGFNGDSRISRVIDKPKTTQLNYMWGNACWSTRFSDFMHNYLASHKTTDQEVVFSDIIQAAIDEQLNVHALPFEHGSYMDTGTSEDLQIAISKYSSSHSLK